MITIIGASTPSWWSKELIQYQSLHSYYVFWYLNIYSKGKRKTDGCMFRRWIMVCLLCVPTLVFNTLKVDQSHDSSALGLGCSHCLNKGFTVSGCFDNLGVQAIQPDRQLTPLPTSVLADTRADATLVRCHVMSCHEAIGNPFVRCSQSSVRHPHND